MLIECVGNTGFTHVSDFMVFALRTKECNLVAFQFRIKQTGKRCPQKITLRMESNEQGHEFLPLEAMAPHQHLMYDLVFDANNQYKSKERTEYFYSPQFSTNNVTMSLDHRSVTLLDDRSCERPANVQAIQVTSPVFLARFPLYTSEEMLVFPLTLKTGGCSSVKLGSDLWLWLANVDKCYGQPLTLRTIKPLNDNTIETVNFVAFNKTIQPSLHPFITHRVLKFYREYNYKADHKLEMPDGTTFSIHPELRSRVIVAPYLLGGIVMLDNKAIVNSRFLPVVFSSTPTETSEFSIEPSGPTDVVLKSGVNTYKLEPGKFGTGWVLTTTLTQN